MKYQTWMKAGSVGLILREWEEKKILRHIKDRNKWKSLSPTRINDECVKEGIQESTKSKNLKGKHHTRLLEKEAD